ncbi:MAG: nitroreductase [Neomegalonema sp.]|nr:nitroreductase [Neomegalonema sp.]
MTDSLTLPPIASQEALDFLRRRRSVPAKTLTAPGPDRAILDDLLTIALRVPDHGKLAPWRLVVLQGEAKDRLAEQVRARGTYLGLDESDLVKGEKTVTDGPVVVCVISSPRPSEKISAHEQELSAACVCFAMVQAALAHGFGANWLTGWVATDRLLAEDAFALKAHESITGLIHIGTARIAPAERERPDLGSLVEYRD